MFAKQERAAKKVKIEVSYRYSMHHVWTKSTMFCTFHFPLRFASQTKLL